MTNDQKEQMANVDQSNLIDTQSRGNTVMRDALESIENTRKSSHHPACEVSIHFAEKPDEAAVADVLRMLMNTGSRG